LIDATASDGQLTLKINRPEKANALTEAMLSELADCIENTEQRVLVITGVGKVFSAGADLEDVQGGTLATSPEWERLSSAVAAFKGLSVASLNGSCAGGALGMVLACDLRIAVETAKFFYPVIKIGVLPQPSDPSR
jgi:enoyl-CoA hydratase/carnithine racemase